MIRIISDSSCDLKKADLQSDKFEFSTVPILINLGDKEFCDAENLDLNMLMTEMKESKAALKTASPSPESFAEEMRKDGDVICITLSSKISGTYNSARIAAETVKKEIPKKKIFVLDSLKTSSAMALVLERLKTLIERGDMSFEEIVKSITEYCANVKIRFVLQDFGNLIKTGRMSRFAGIIASVLTIRPICGDNGAGEIKMYKKVFGNKKALVSLCNLLVEKFEKEGNEIPVVITHCNNEIDAQFLKALLQSSFGLVNIKIYKMRGTASCYANDKGISIAY